MSAAAVIVDLADYRHVTVNLTLDGQRIRFECLTLRSRGMAEHDIALALGLEERVVTILLKAPKSRGKTK
jgi:hypothetical protein